MLINDLLQIAIVIGSIVGALCWVLRLRRWPLMIAAVLALLSNVVFLAFKSRGAAAADLNLLSLVRVFLLVLVLASIPFAVQRK